MASPSGLRTNVLLRSEQSGGEVSLMENVVPARVCTPGGLERMFVRMAAEAEGTEPPEWALQPAPEVIEVGPQIAWDE